MYVTNQQSPNDAHTAFHVAAVLALMTAIDMARSGLFGRGSAVALTFSGVFAAAAVLLWTGPSDLVHIAGENTVAHVLRRSTVVAFAGYVCIAARLGFVSLLAVPLYWLSLPIVVVSVIVWIGVRMGAGLTASGDH
jgi:hypothetical protein